MDILWQIYLRIYIHDAGTPEESDATPYEERDSVVIDAIWQSF